MRLALVCLALIAAGAASAECPTPPAGIRDIEANSYYSDSHHSIIDPALKAKNEAAVKPFDDYLRVVSDNADRYIADGDKAAAACVLTWLDRWAQDGAMLGHMSSNQAEYERKWMLAGFALAYLKVRPEVTDEQKQRIGPWMQRLAAKALDYADSQKTKNNHYYWVGLAVMATGVATNDPSEIALARRVYDDALSDIERDGSLPLELNRAGRALHYHNYSLAPLVLIAELARSVGEDWYHRQDGRLDKLARLVLVSLQDPSWFVRQTGEPQEVPKGGILGWTAFYRSIDPSLDPLIDALRNQAPFRYAQLGGNMSLLAEKKFFERH